MRYKYQIDLDERDVFYAHVEDGDGDTIFEIGSSDGTYNLAELIEDGFMKHGKDVAGLESYLKSIGLLEAKDELISEYKE